MSFFGDFVGGAAEAGGGIIGNQIRTDQNTEAANARAQFDNDLAVARAKTIQDMTNQNADFLRTQQVGRIDTAAGNIVDPMIQQKRGIINSSIADKGNWTPEQQAAVDQSLDLDKSTATTDPKVRMQAAIATGDIDPKTAATMGQSAEINQMKFDNLLARANDRNATNEQIANIRADAMRDAAQLRVDAANQRAATGKIDTATGRMLITSEDVNIKANTSQIAQLRSQLKEMRPTDSKGKPNQDYLDIKSQIDDLNDDIQSSKDKKTSYLKDMGLMKQPAGTPSAKVGKSPYPDGTVLSGPGGKSYVVKNGQPVPQ